MRKYHSISVFSALLLSTALVGCGGSSSSSSDNQDPGQDQDQDQSSNPNLSGLVRDFNTGDPIPNAELTLRSTSFSEPLTVTSDDEGNFGFEAPDGDARATLTGRADEYGSSSLITSTGEDADNDNLELSLVKAQVNTTFAGDASTRVDLDGFEGLAEIPANAFGTNGTPYTGTVNTQVTVLDPSGDPSIISGSYTLLDENGEEVPLSTYGAVAYDFTDEDGNALDLNSGTQVTIRIPVAEDANNPPSDVPLAYFNEETGQWTQEGIALLDGSGDFYESEVSHFTSWLVGDTYETVNISSRVTNPDGEPVSGARVRARGSDYIGESTAISGTDGNFTISARENSTVFIRANSGGASNTRTIVTADEDQDLTGDSDNDFEVSDAAVSITFTWGENPRDLDTHFFGPKDELGTDLFHIYFGHKTEILDGTTIDLDVDDTSSFGPEVVTIPEFPFPGRYSYLIHLWAGSGDIESSSARVEFNIDGRTEVFSPVNAQGDAQDSNGNPTLWWAVADLIVEEDGTVRLEATQEWRGDLPDDHTITSPYRSGSGTSGASLDATTNPAASALERKYYSPDSQ